MNRRNRVCCVFPLVHTSASYKYIYVYIHTLGWVYYYKRTDKILCVVSFHWYIHPDHICIYTSIYIHWAECRITNKTKKSCVLCLCTCTYIQIVYVHIHLYTYFGLSVELKMKRRDFVCCVFPVVRTSGSTYIYIYSAERGIKNEKTRSCVLCLSTCTYIRIYICLYTYIGLSVASQMKRQDLVCCVFPLVHATAFYVYIYIHIHTLGWV